MHAGEPARRALAKHMRRLVIGWAMASIAVSMAAAEPSAADANPPGASSAVIQPGPPVNYTRFDGGHETLIPWVGRNIAVLTPVSGSFSPTTMTEIIGALDNAWDYYAAITSRVPFPAATYQGRDSIAVVSTSCGAACSYSGATGTEINGPYFETLYDGVASNNQYDQAMFYEFGRNFWFYHDALGPGTAYGNGPAATGYAIFMRFWSMNRTGVPGGPFNGTPFSTFESQIWGIAKDYDSDLSKTFANTLAVGASPSIYGGGDFEASILNLLASHYGGDCFLQAFFSAVSREPSAPTDDAAVTNFIEAASEVAGVDLHPFFYGYWSFPRPDGATSPRAAGGIAALPAQPGGSICAIASTHNRSTYHPLSPVRLLDTRSSNGHGGKLAANTPATFQITGRAGIPSGATAVTGNVTVVNSSSSWAVYLGPAPVAKPTSSTINFSAGQITGNGLTVALSASGTLSATYMGPAGARTDLVFDVTGFYTPDSSGETYHPVNPVRELDTRYGNGLSGKLTANTPYCFGVDGRNGVPLSARAVTGNLTVVNPTSSWALYLGPLSTSTPTTSAVNFTGGQVAGNNVTVALNTSGQLCATYMGPAGAQTDLVFDVTGYFTADATGASFVPINPTRLLDTRSGNGLVGQLTANTPRIFLVATRGGLPADATGVTGNVTVVSETAGWAVFLGPASVSAPTTSTINFAGGDIKGNGLTVALSFFGSLSATYMSSTGNRTDLVFDVTGYFLK